MQQHLINGFYKRAAAYGVSAEQASFLLKKADAMSDYVNSLEKNLSVPPARNLPPHNPNWLNELFPHIAYPPLPTVNADSLAFGQKPSTAPTVALNPSQYADAVANPSSNALQQAASNPEMYNPAAMPAGEVADEYRSMMEGGTGGAAPENQSALMALLAKIDPKLLALLGGGAALGGAAGYYMGRKKDNKK